MTIAAVVLSGIAVNEWDKKSRELMPACSLAGAVRLYILDKSYTKIRLGLRALTGQR